MTHFEELRDRINRRLEELQTPHRRLQAQRYSWLYGALGEVPSEVMLICENPSLAGVERAHIDTVDGGPPDIEAQWWGGRRNPAAKRLRVVLREVGLKTSRPDVKGGWKCYITNVVKEANIAGEDQASLSRAEKNEQAAAWADILAWELEEVSPTYVFAVGGQAHDSLKYLQRVGLYEGPPPIRMAHYSGRGSDDSIMEEMRRSLRLATGSSRIA